MKETPSFNRRGRFLAMKRASLHIEETPSLFANSSIYSPSPFGEGLGVRLLLSPWGRLGGVIPFGEGMG